MNLVCKLLGHQYVFIPSQSNIYFYEGKAVVMVCVRCGHTFSFRENNQKEQQEKKEQ